MLLNLTNKESGVIKNTAIKVTFEAVENLIKNSIDKNKLNIAYKKDLEQAKIALKKTIT